MNKLTEAQIISIASRREFIYNPYSYRDSNYTQTLRRLVSEGKLVVIRAHKNQWWYRTPALHELTKIVEARLKVKYGDM